MPDQKTIIEQKIKTELPAEDSPAVIAYRVGKLEDAVTHGFEAVNQKLDKLDGFMTKNEAKEILKEERKDAAVIHEGFSKRIKKLEDWKDGLITKIAAAAVIMLVVMLLAVYGLDKFFTI